MSVLSNIISLLSGAGGAGYQRISGKDARERLAAERGIKLVDVRTTGEYRARRIAGSLLIPVQLIDTQAPKQLPNKETPLIVYCQIGARSRKAATALLALGYTHVYDLGSIANWPGETVTG